MSNEGSFYINVVNFREHINSLKQTYSKYNTNCEQFLTICSKMGEKWNDNLTNVFLSMISKEQENTQKFYDSFIEHCDQDLRFCENITNIFNKYGIAGLQNLEFSHAKINEVVSIMENSVMRSIESVLEDLSPMTVNNRTNKYRRRWYGRARSSSAIGEIDSVKYTFDRIHKEMSIILERYRGINNSVVELIEATYSVVKRINPNLINNNQMRLTSNKWSANETVVKEKDVKDYGVQDSTAKIEREEAERIKINDMIDNVTITDISLEEKERERVNPFASQATYTNIDLGKEKRELPSDYETSKIDTKIKREEGKRVIASDYGSNSTTETLNLSEANRTIINDLSATNSQANINIANNVNNDKSNLTLNTQKQNINFNNQNNTPTTEDYNYQKIENDIHVASIDAPVQVGEFSVNSDSQNLSLGNTEITKVSSNYDTSEIAKDIDIAISNTIGK